MDEAARAVPIRPVGTREAWGHPCSPVASRSEVANGLGAWAGGWLAEEWQVPAELVAAAQTIEGALLA